MIPPLAAGASLRNLPWNRPFSKPYTAVCKIIPACLNFRGTVAANECLSAPTANQPFSERLAEIIAS